MNLQRLAVKLFAETGFEPPLPAFIPVFHRWIQSRALDGVWIDVADYSHVPQGPGILLVGHEANLALDETGGRRGLLCSRKQASAGTLGERLEAVLDTVRTAVALLERDPDVGGTIRFRTDEVEIALNDRLRAPNRADVFASLRPELERFAARIFDGPTSLTREPDARERLTVRIRAEGPAALREPAAA